MQRAASASCQATYVPYRFTQTTKTKTKTQAAGQPASLCSLVLRVCQILGDIPAMKLPWPDIIFTYLTKVLVPISVLPNRLSSAPTRDFHQHCHIPKELTTLLL